MNLIEKISNLGFFSREIVFTDESIFTKECRKNGARKIVVANSRRTEIVPTAAMGISKGHPLRGGGLPLVRKIP